MLTLALMAAGVALIIVILGFFGIAEVASLLAAARIELVLLAVALQVVMLLMLTWRMKVLASGQGWLGWRHAFRAVNAGLVVNFLTPIAKIGGEPVKVLMLRQNFGTSKATAIVTMDTLVELFSAFVTVLVIFLFFFNRLPADFALWIGVFLVAVVAAFAALGKIISSPLLIKRIVSWFVRKSAKHKRIEKKDYAALFYDSFKRLFKDKPLMTKVLGISFAMKLLEFARMWLAFLALGFVAPLDVVIIAWAVMLVLFMIPWLPGSLGLVEFGIAAVFVAFAVPQAIAAGGVLLDRFISFWFVLIFGIAVAGATARQAIRDRHKISNIPAQKVKQEIGGKKPQAL